MPKYNPGDKLKYNPNAKINSYLSKDKFQRTVIVQSYDPSEWDHSGGCIIDIENKRHYGDRFYNPKITKFEEQLAEIVSE